MYVQIINLKLKDVSEEDYFKLCDDLAPTFAAVPGLVHKVWIANSSTGTYGGIYFWKDRETMVEFTKTDLFRTVEGHPNLTNITSTDFGVMEGPTKVTRGFAG
jgi:hypothetical protein